MIQINDYNINWTKLAAIGSVCVIGWAIVKYVAGPFFKSMLLGQLKESHVELKEILDEVYFKEFADLQVLKEDVSKLTIDTARQNKILEDIASTVNESSNDISFIKGMLDRRQHPRELPRQPDTDAKV